MIFTVELSDDLKHYRLQKDGTWRRLESDALLESDFQTENPAEVTRRTPHGQEIELENVVYKVSPASGRYGEILGAVSKVYRREFPEVIPSKGQLRSVIAAGEDGVHNSLILNVHGQFELRQRPPFEVNINDPSVVVRQETFAAGNDYVGAEAAQDDNHIERLFVSSLQGWILHLEAGLTQIYSGEYLAGDARTLLEKIESLRSAWIPSY